ncbi:MAG TPA: hypothetical protein VFO29_01505 [Candidatus Rubrimentiphilum sp.]|nr:hypothetical protein [Candidatus Rubrimentiphilum sp.]
MRYPGVRERSALGRLGLDFLRRQWVDEVFLLPSVGEAAITSRADCHGYQVPLLSV